MFNLHYGTFWHGALPKTETNRVKIQFHKTVKIHFAYILTIGAESTDDGTVPNYGNMCLFIRSKYEDFEDSTTCTAEDLVVGPRREIELRAHRAIASDYVELIVNNGVAMIASLLIFYYEMPEEAVNWPQDKPIRTYHLLF